ncbi:MAG TPA: hypothetical protein PKC67_05850 [Kiritimatiellia bacterium]|nr:hypothetical protein [Kiritimatiellia bacterium]HMP33858.1 hypothetical protein [Kiritimatiellia bacterium]
MKTKRKLGWWMAVLSAVVLGALALGTLKNRESWVKAMDDAYLYEAAGHLQKQQAVRW